jgi:hypothetical protein
MEVLDVSEIRNKRSKSFYDAVCGTALFFYYVSPIGYVFDNYKHNLAIEIFKNI